MFVTSGCPRPLEKFLELLGFHPSLMISRYRYTRISPTLSKNPVAVMVESPEILDVLKCQ